jgi:hypothetical protein
LAGDLHGSHGREVAEQRAALGKLASACFDALNFLFRDLYAALNEVSFYQSIAPLGKQKSWMNSAVNLFTAASKTGLYLGRF